MDFSKYKGYISNSGGDERGKLSGGQAGDQTGKEWCIRTWYNRPWNCVLRHPEKAVGDKIAELSIKAALNDCVGYNQADRLSYWECLKQVGYDPSAIRTKCNADCSAGVIANVRATGYILGLSALESIQATYTGNMRQALKSAGFKVLTEGKYLTGWEYLETGDILLNDVHHTAVYIGSGTGVKEDNPCVSASGEWVHIQAATYTSETDAKALTITLTQKGIRSEYYKTSTGYYVVHCGCWKKDTADEILKELKANGITGLSW